MDDVFLFIFIWNPQICCQREEDVFQVVRDDGENLRVSRVGCAVLLLILLYALLYGLYGLSTTQPSITGIGVPWSTF